LQTFSAATVFESVLVLMPRTCWGVTVTPLSFMQLMKAADALLPEPPPPPNPPWPWGRSDAHACMAAAWDGLTEAPPNPPGPPLGRPLGRAVPVGRPPGRPLGKVTPWDLRQSVYWVNCDEPLAPPDAAAPAAGAVEPEEHPVSSSAPDARRPAAARTRGVVVLLVLLIMTGGSSIRLRAVQGVMVAGSGEHGTACRRPNRTGVGAPWAKTADFLGSDSRKM
jgi:hypothetical protein